MLIKKSNKANSPFDFVMRNNILSKSKRSQVTIFVILVIVIVAGIVLFFAFKGGLLQGKIPQELEPVYNYYLSCIEGEALNGILILDRISFWEKFKKILFKK